MRLGRGSSAVIGVVTNSITFIARDSANVTSGRCGRSGIIGMIMGRVVRGMMGWFMMR